MIRFLNRMRRPLAMTIILVVFALALSVAGVSCSSGGNDADPSKTQKPKKKKREKKQDKGDDAGKPEKKPAPPAENPGPGDKAPPEKTDPEPGPEENGTEIPLVLRLPLGNRSVYQLSLSYERRKGEKITLKRRVDGSRFLLCASAGERGMTVVRETPNPLEEIVDGEARPPRRIKDVDLLHVLPNGGISVLNAGSECLLIEGMVDIGLPEKGVAAVGSSWTREHAFADGSFVLSYLLAGPDEVEGEKAVRIDMEAALPGGVPCDAMEFDHGRATYWFSSENGRVLKAMGNLVYTLGEGEGAERFEGNFELRFFGTSPASRDEVDQAGAALKAYQAVCEMLEKRMYARAEKTINEFVDATDVAAYARMMDALRRKIPDTRQVETSGLLERKRFHFLGYPWRQDLGAELVLQGCGKMVDGAPRTLKVAGLPFPKVWWKNLIRGGKWKDIEAGWKGKPRVLHIWASWVPACAESVGALENFAESYAEKGVAFFGITIDTEKKKLEQFFKAHPTKYPTLWDEKNTAVKELKLPGIPVFLVLDKTDKITFAEMGWFGEATTDRLRKALEAAQK